MHAHIAANPRILRDLETLVLSFLELLIHENGRRFIGSSRGLARLARLLYVSYHVLSQPPSTERDVYYRQAALFGDQPSVHRTVGRLCGLLQRASQAVGPSPSLLLPLRSASGGSGDRSVEPSYTRETLGVFAAPRGTLVGPLLLHLTDTASQPIGPLPRLGGAMVEALDVRRCGLDGVGVSADMAARLSAMDWVGEDMFKTAPGRSAIVVLEKESTLRSLWPLYAERHRESSTDWKWRFAFLCTKGYPSHSARLLLGRIHELCPMLPMLTLVDGDPHGLRIALTTAERRTVDMSGVTDVLPLCYVGLRPSTAPRHRCATLSTGDVRVLDGLHTRLQRYIGMKDTKEVDRMLWAASAREMQAEVAWMQQSGLRSSLQSIPAAQLLPLLDAEAERYRVLRDSAGEMHSS